MTETLKNKIEEAMAAAKVEETKGSEAPQQEEVTEKKSLKETLTGVYNKYKKPAAIAAGVVATATVAFVVGKKLGNKGKVTQELEVTDPLEALDALDAIDAVETAPTIEEPVVETTPELVTINF